MCAVCTSYVHVCTRTLHIQAPCSMHAHMWTHTCTQHAYAACMHTWTLTNMHTAIHIPCGIHAHTRLFTCMHTIHTCSMHAHTYTYSCAHTCCCLCYSAWSRGLGTWREGQVSPTQTVLSPMQAQWPPAVPGLKAALEIGFQIPTLVCKPVFNYSAVRSGCDKETRPPWLLALVD